MEIELNQSEESHKRRQCPFCKESIHIDAIKCKHCGSFLVPVSQQHAVPREYVAQGSSGTFDAMLGHGWSLIVISVIFLIMITNSMPDDLSPTDESIGLSIIGGIIVMPWAIWVLNKPMSNKVLPGISVVIMLLSMADGILQP